MALTNDDLDRVLDRFIREEIALTQDDISSAVRSKKWLLEQIEAKIASKVTGPELYAAGPFVGYGSYFAYLKVSDVDEMDFLVVIDSNSGVFRKEDGIEYGKGLGTASPNHKYDTRFKKADLSGVSPSKLLFWLKDICWEVLEPLGGEEPVIDGPAVKVVLKSKGINFDLVPAGVFERTDWSGNLFYNIPKGDLSDGWVLTNPKKDLERINRLADRCEGLRNVIRVMKLIRDKYEIPISSYAIQCSGCLFAEGYQWQRNLSANLHLALIHLSIKLRSGIIEDGFDPSNNLLKDVSNSGDHANTIQAVLGRLEALSNESDEDVAYEKLHQILKNTTEGARGRNLGLASGFSTIASLLYPEQTKKNPWSL